MKKKRFSAEQIIGKLREAEVLLNQRSTLGEVIPCTEMPLKMPKRKLRI